MKKNDLTRTLTEGAVFVAAAMALCYRGLIFWVPFAIGAVCINFTGRAGKVFKPAEEQLRSKPPAGTA